MMLNACVDAMFTMQPRPRSTMPGSAARQPCHTPSRSTAKQRRQSSSLIVSGSANTLMPALFTSTSSGPNSASVRASAARTESWRVTSACSASTRAPSTSAAIAAAIAAAVRCACSTSTSSSATHAPSRANACAIAAPMPRAAPVTAATLPASRAITRLRRAPRAGRPGTRARSRPSRPPSGPADTAPSRARSRSRRPPGTAACCPA